MDRGRLADSYARIAVAAALAGGVAYAVWLGLDQALGRALGAQIASVGGALALSAAVYLVLARLLHVRELDTLLSLRRRSATTR
jgi:hypothetical protein